MSLLARTMLEAERDSALAFIQAVSHDGGLQAILREEGLRAAMQAAAASGRFAPNSTSAGAVVVNVGIAGSGTRASGLRTTRR